MVLGFTAFIKALLEGGAIAGSMAAIGTVLGLVIGGIAQASGKGVDPWKLATERGASLGACTGVVIALVEVVHWK